MEVGVGTSRSCGLEDPFAADAVTLARRLLGATFRVDGVGGVIVETEAYTRSDAASHSFRGPTPRNRAMFGPVGRLYVYRSYGIHWCVNIVCDAGEPGSAVLLRALEPTDGVEAMERRRGTTERRLLCAGPGRLAQALALSLADDGADLADPRFALELPQVAPLTAAGPRIGITKAVNEPWRFAVSGSRFLSRPMRIGRPAGG